MGSLLPGRQKFFHQRVRKSPVAHDGEKNSGNPGQQLGFDQATGGQFIPRDDRRDGRDAHILPRQ